MNIQDLMDKGGFVDAEPVRKEIEWMNDDGETLQAGIWIVRQSYGVLEGLAGNAGSDRSQGAKMISLCVRLGDSEPKEQLTYDQAFRLIPALALAMAKAIREVNSPKKSEPLTSSSTSLSSPASAAGRSRKRKLTSVTRKSSRGKSTGGGTGHSS